MLNFTKQKLHIRGESIFYYDRYNSLNDIQYFSNSIHQDLKDYLGIQRELRLREKLSKAITNDQKRYEEIKFYRINMFYDYYLDQVLQMMQMLYYENFQLINEDTYKKFLIKFYQIEQNGLKLQQCFDKALELCEDIKLMIEKQIKEEYPLQTFSDIFQQKQLMLPFTHQNLIINNRNIFYYNRSCHIPEIYIFSNAIFQDLYNFLGIEFEINQRQKMAEAVDPEGKQKYYDSMKIGRITIFYDFYVDSVLKMMQLLYYETINNQDLYLFCTGVSTLLKTEYINSKADDYDKTFSKEINKIVKSKVNSQDADIKRDREEFLYFFDENVEITGRRLKDCFKIALEKCQPLKTMIDQQINIEFPLQTFQDKIVQKEKIVVSNKKTVKK